MKKKTKQKQKKKINDFALVKIMLKDLVVNMALQMTEKTKQLLVLIM